MSAAGNGRATSSLSAEAMRGKVREEKGCIEYFPTVDIDAKLPQQNLDENVVTIIEEWENLEALRDHLEAPHMLDYREKVKNIVAGLSLKVLREA